MYVSMTSEIESYAVVVFMQSDQLISVGVYSGEGWSTRETSLYSFREANTNAKNIYMYDSIPVTY